MDPERGEAIALLRGALSDGEAEVQAGAIVALADLEAVEAVGSLVPFLGDAAIRVRQMAVVALGELAEPGDAEVVGRIRGLLAAGEPALRFQALAAWARLAPEALEEELIERSEDSDAEVRTLAIRLAEEHWIGADQFPTDALVAMARARLDDESACVRLQAAIFLARAGLESSRNVLVAAVQRRAGVTEPSDEQTAIELSGELGLRAAIPSLRRRAFGWFGVSRDPFAWHARVALARMGDERARAAIEKGLQARSWHTRTVAVEAASRAGLVGFLPLLESMQARGESIDAEILGEAIERLKAEGRASSAAGRSDGAPVESR